MNTKVRTTFQAMRTPTKHEKEKIEMQDSKAANAEKVKDHRRSSRERKMTLQQDVDKLKKKLRHQENVHRALERAFTRPLGALPRLPPYLPPNTLELLAEVAVLEEEVIRLEEQLVNFRQGLYQEAVYISSSKKTLENAIDLYDQYPNKNFKAERPKSSSQVPELDAVMGRALPLVRNDSGAKPHCSDFSVSQIGQCSSRPLNGKRPQKNQSCSSFAKDRFGKENQSRANSSKSKQSSPQKVTRIKASAKMPPAESRYIEKQPIPLKLLQQECQTVEQERVEGSSPSIATGMVSEDSSSCPNEISEDILKCLSSIFLSMTTTNSSGMEMDTLPSTSGSCECSEEMEFRDPYNICSEFGRRDIGSYKHVHLIEASLIDPNWVANSLLIRRLKRLQGKLATVNLRSLTHQQKLAFWINVYNACMMNVFLEHGIPSSPQMVVALMRKAMINVGGHLLNAMTIEHFILRMPYNSKSTHLKCTKNDEVTIRSIFALDWPEPLVTFALSCGSWSSPAVRVYTASEVENELQTAKMDYLQAAVGISTTKLAIPKLLDWYVLDFAKDLDSLLDWICLQLPSGLRKEALASVERGRKEVFSPSVQVIPYEFSFRYILSP